MPVGILLAAGAGTRMGRPKALVCDADGTSWLLRSVRALADGGCGPVLVVLGAAAQEAEALLEGAGRTGAPLAEVDVRIVVAAEWREGMSASLRSGLSHALALDDDRWPRPTAACLSLVDLPDVDARVVARVVGVLDGSVGEEERMLARAAYEGVAGHPVLLGRDHWIPLTEQLSGDRGARDYLATRPVQLVECADLATGSDVDTAEVDPR